MNLLQIIFFFVSSNLLFSCMPTKETVKSPVIDSQVVLKQVKTSVLDFGAKGDGITDDTKAFKEAINTGYLYIPKGVFKVKNLPFVDNLSIVCESSKSIVEGVTENDVIFKNAKFRGNIEITGGTWRNAQTLILHEGDRSLHSSIFKGMTISNCATGMAFSSSVGNTFENLKFTNVKTALHFGRNGNKNVHNINHIKGCKIMHFEDYGIYFENNNQKKSNNTIENCWLEQSTGTGVYLGNNCFSTVIQNSYFESLGSGETDREITIGGNQQSICPGTKILNNVFKRTKAGSKVPTKILLRGETDITAEGNEVILQNHQKFIKFENKVSTHSFLKNNKLTQIKRKNQSNLKAKASKNNPQKLFDRSGKQKVTYSLEAASGGTDSYKEFKEGQLIYKIYEVDSSPTPSVKEGNIFKVPSGQPVSNFVGGINGLQITLIAKSNRTIKNNKNISLNNGQDFKMKIDNTLTIIFDSNKWIEISRKN